MNVWSNCVAFFSSVQFMSVTEAKEAIVYDKCYGGKYKNRVILPIKTNPDSDGLTAVFIPLASLLQCGTKGFFARHGNRIIAEL